MIERDFGWKMGNIWNAMQLFGCLSVYANYEQRKQSMEIFSSSESFYA